MKFAQIGLKNFFILLIVFVITDQVIKYGFVFWDWGYDGHPISLTLAYNYGVAFSMFAFLEGNLKFIQLLMLIGGIIYLVKNPMVFSRYALALSFLFAGGLSNILDRFTYGAVVDYIYVHHYFDWTIFSYNWQYDFRFAIFNLADILINISVALILYLQYKYAKEDEKQKA